MTERDPRVEPLPWRTQRVGPGVGEQVGPELSAIEQGEEGSEASRHPGNKSEQA